MREYKSYFAGQFQESQNIKEIKSVYSQNKVANVYYIQSENIESILKATSNAFSKYKQISRYHRSLLLNGLSKKISQNEQIYVQLMIEESGKPIDQAKIEVKRAIQTFQYAAEEVKRFAGEMIPLDIDEFGLNYHECQVHFVPRGPVLAITPFNFPLNLVAHKLAPAWAAGCSVVLKPAPQSPGCAQQLHTDFLQVLKDLELQNISIPKDIFQIVHAEPVLIEKLIASKNVYTVSFTGSAEVGFKIQSLAVQKKVILELGGNAALVVCKDADIETAVQRCIQGGFGFAGQSCISVQRVFIAQEIFKNFKGKLVNETLKVITGDPFVPGTLVGPVIDDKAKNRILDWIQEAQAQGAKLLCGGHEKSLLFKPMIFENTNREMKIVKEEVFAPLITIQSFTQLEQAVEQINDSKFGLQVGIYTNCNKTINYLFEHLAVGGVIVNDIPTIRFEHMPYGGVKQSGLGREGLRYAMFEYSELKSLISKK